MGASYLVTQGYGIVNDAFKEVIGDKASGALDSTDIVTMGRALSDYDLLDAFYGALTNKIAKTITYVLNYKANGRQILHDSVSYGAFIEKIYVDSMDAVANPVYNVTQSSGTMSNIADPYGVTAVHTITTKVFGAETTWSYEFNTDTVLLRKAFRSDADIMSFVDGIFQKAQTDIELEKEGLVTLAINTAIEGACRTGCGYNLLQRYNNAHPTATLTRAQAQLSKDYYAWANKELNKIVKLMARPSKKFNGAKYLNASPRDNIILEVLSDYAESSRAFAESSTYHDDKIAIAGTYNEVEFWQFFGEDFDTQSKVSVKNKDLWKSGSTAVEFTTDGVVAIARDRDAVGAIFELDYQWSMPNPRARINSYGYDFNRGYMYEPHANFVVFTMNDVDYDIPEGADISIIGDVVVGNEIEIVPTASTGKTVGTVSYDIGAGAVTVSATGGKYKLTVPSCSSIKFSFTES